MVSLEAARTLPVATGILKDGRQTDRRDLLQTSGPSGLGEPLFKSHNQRLDSGDCGNLGVFGTRLRALPLGDLGQDEELNGTSPWICQHGLRVSHSGDMISLRDTHQAVWAKSQSNRAR